ncbi:hypothetical protein BpHYR1_010481, partial [Brachionus plicatilis]
FVSKDFNQPKNNTIGPSKTGLHLVLATSTTLTGTQRIVLFIKSIIHFPTGVHRVKKFPSHPQSELFIKLVNHLDHTQLVRRPCIRKVPLLFGVNVREWYAVVVVYGVADVQIDHFGLGHILRRLYSKPQR